MAPARLIELLVADPSKGESLPTVSDLLSLGYTPRSVATYFKCAISDDPDIPDVISVGQSSCRGIPYGADGRRNVHNERPQQGNA